MTDWDWQAFCYLNDELSVEERESFEQALAEDQPAREALACMVELEGALLATPREAFAAPAEQPITRRLQVAAAVVALAASLIGVVALVLSQQDPAEPQPLAVNSHANGQVALAWSEMLAETPESDHLAELLAEETPESLDDWSVEPEELADQASDAAPSWLLAAVRSGEPAGEVMED